MSRTLSDVLHESAVKHHARLEEERARREEWIASVDRLMKQLRQWLQEATITPTSSSRSIRCGAIGTGWRTDGGRICFWKSSACPRDRRSR